MPERAGKASSGQQTNPDIIGARRLPSLIQKILTQYDPARKQVFHVVAICLVRNFFAGEMTRGVVI